MDIKSYQRKKHPVRKSIPNDLPREVILHDISEHEKLCDCGSPLVKIAQMPRLLLPKSLATPELVAYTVIAKYCDHIPLYRQQNIWDRLGFDMPRSSLCGWLLTVTEVCEPLVELLRRDIIPTDYAQADETTVQVLDEIGRKITQRYISGVIAVVVINPVLFMNISPHEVVVMLKRS
jgi:transposase